MSDKVFNPAIAGPQPDHTPDYSAPSPAPGAPGGPPPAPLAPPTVTGDAVLLLHAIMTEVVGELRQLATQVPTASASVARFDTLRTRLAAVFNPPKP